MSDEERKATRIADQALSYSRASFYITAAQFVASVAIGAIGLYIGVSGVTRDPVSLVAILGFLYLVLISGLVLSRPLSKTASLDVPDFIRRVNSLGRVWVLTQEITEHTKDKQNSAMMRTYNDTVRFLYMVALAHGRKDLADELWRLYSLENRPPPP